MRNKGEKTTKPSGSFTWVCPACHASLTAAATDLICTECPAAYPYICGLPILVRDPGWHLGATLQQALATSEAARNRLKLVNSIPEGRLPDKSLARLRQVGAAQVTNALMFERLMRPVKSWISHAAQSAEPRQGTITGHASNLGWAATDLTPFMLRDWRSDQELGVAVDFVSSSLDRHLDAAKRGTLVMLGCGAGAMAGRLSSKFSWVIGLELSVAMLLAVRRLQVGKRMCLRYPVSTSSGTRVRRIALHAAPSALQHVSFAAADAGITPLLAGSVDCVTTCFLLDILDDPAAVAREVHRILKESGIWISYGPSGSMSAVRRFDDAELSEFVRAAGFSVLETAHHRTTHLDLRQIDESTHYHSHMCYLSVARKE